MSRARIEAFRQRRDELLSADLAHAREAIALGSLDTARECLVRISTYARPSASIPPSLALEIGAIYRELGFVALAGFYWYPIEEKSAEMREACEEFERSLAGHPVLICDAFQYHHCLPWGPENSALKSHCREAERLRNEHRVVADTDRGWRDRMALLGCAIVCFVILMVLIAGVVAICRVLAFVAG